MVRGPSLIISFLLRLKVASDQGPCRKYFALHRDDAMTREIQLFSEIRRPSTQQRSPEENKLLVGCGAVSELGVGSDSGRRLESLSGSPNLKSVSKGEGQSGESGKEQKMFCIDDLVWNRQSRDPDQLVWRPPAGDWPRNAIGNRSPGPSA